MLLRSRWLLGFSIIAGGATSTAYIRRADSSSHGHVLNRSYIEAFSRDGFVVVPDLLNPEEIAAIRNAILNEVRPLLEVCPPVEERGAFQRVFEKFFNLWERSAAVHPIPFDPKIAGAAFQLLGGDLPVRIWHDSVLVKVAGGSKTPAHQDHPYWPMNENEHHALTAWIPLSPKGSTFDSGAVGYIPGSHKSEIFSFQDIFANDEKFVNDVEAKFLADERLKGIPFQYVEVPPGGVAFHHSRTIHAALPNHSKEDRPAYCIIYFKDGCTRDNSNRLHACTNRQGRVIKPGEAIDSDVTPIAFPIAKLPPQPAVPCPENEIERLRTQDGKSKL